LQIEALTELAMERCDTAECAVTLIGNFSVDYGYYGPGWVDGGEAAASNAGEALIISDPEEVWVLHLIPDDTHSSAVWVAQRLPDDHITVIANSFTIGNIIPDDPNFLYSPNLYQVAERNGLWRPDDGYLNFKKLFSLNLAEEANLISRRVWRTFTLANPKISSMFSHLSDNLLSIGFGPGFQSPYPFSIQVEKPITLEWMMMINRDQYDGSIYDLSKDPIGGPFGDTIRFSSGGVETFGLDLGITLDQESNGKEPERAISLYWTTYSIITQSRAHLPDSIGGRTWFAPYAPHFSIFFPIYASTLEIPKEFKHGTICKSLSPQNVTHFTHSLLFNTIR
jgi:dipeptidase